jgi:hypothetical protein
MLNAELVKDLSTYVGVIRFCPASLDSGLRSSELEAMFSIHKLSIQN